MAHFPFKSVSLKALEEAARRVHAVRDQHGVAPPALQPVLRLHVDEDVVHDLVDPVPRTRDLPHRAPASAELSLSQVAEPLGLEIEPLVDLGLRGQMLVDVPRLVTQVQNDPVAYRLVVLVGVDVGTEGLYAPTLCPTSRAACP